MAPFMAPFMGPCSCNGTVMRSVLPIILMLRTSNRCWTLRITYVISSWDHPKYTPDNGPIMTYYGAIWGLWDPSKHLRMHIGVYPIFTTIYTTLNARARGRRGWPRDAYHPLRPQYTPY